MDLSQSSGITMADVYKAIFGDAYSAYEATNGAGLKILNNGSNEV